MPTDWVPILLIVFRWIHFVAGITWIGLLYFFNFVNVPYTKMVDPKDRPAHVPKLLPLALAWFRYAALVTVLAGLGLIYLLYWRHGDLVNSDNAKTIFTGMLLGLTMFFNVWVFIWPNQRKVIEATVKGQKPDPQWGKTALYASRTNVSLSFPMLLFMGSSSHFPLDWPQIILWGIITAAIGAGLVLYVQR